MRPYRDRPDIEVDCEWKWCPEGAVTVPYFHAFGSHLNDWGERRLDPAVGEVPKRLGRTRGECSPRFTGLHFCGTESAWTEGILYADATPIEVDADGIPLCCAAGPLQPGGIVLAGDALQGASTEQRGRLGLRVGIGATGIVVAGVYAPIGVRFGILAGTGAVSGSAPVGVRVGVQAANVSVGSAHPAFGVRVGLGVAGEVLGGAYAILGVAVGIGGEGAQQLDERGELGVRVGLGAVPSAIAGGVADLGIRLGLGGAGQLQLEAKATLGVRLGLGSSPATVAGSVGELGVRLGLGALDQLVKVRSCTLGARLGLGGSGEVAGEVPEVINRVSLYGAGAVIHTIDAATKWVRIVIIGGGGGGAGSVGGSGTASCGGGGGGGGYVEYLTGTPAAGYQATVGAAGTGGTGGGGGVAGGDTTLAIQGGAALAQALGGTGGVNIAAGTSTTQTGIAVGGQYSGGNVGVAGGSGRRGQRQSGTSAQGGEGGDTVLGFGGPGSQLGNGGAGTGYGGGGGGASSASATATNGGDGRPGVMIVYEYK